MSHTKRDWKIQNLPTGDSEIWAIGVPKIAIVYGSNVSINEQRANALLISAAPELAEICFDILKLWHSKPSNMYKKEPYYLEPIRKALKKAGI